MEFRKKLKKFFTLTRTANGGFTLVELIVVIAILAILAGVGIPVYSGYIEKTNRAADETLIAEIKNALALQYYAEGLIGEANVILSDKGAQSPDAFAVKAMEAAFGSNWQSVAALKSNSWGNSVGVTKEVLDHFEERRNDTTDPLNGIYMGTTQPSFVKDVETLFPEVEETAKAVGGHFETSGAALLQGAADLTLGITVPAGNTQKPAEYFADKWATAGWDSSYLMGSNAGHYGAGVGSNSNQEVVNGAVANAAVIKARNTAVEGYLRRAMGENFPANAYGKISDYTFDNSQVPMDFVGDWQNANTNAQKGALLEKVGIPKNQALKVKSAIDTYFAGGTSSEAYKDGLAYFAMMDTVNSVNPNENDETYWNEMKSAVDKYSEIANDPDAYDGIKSYYDSMNLADAKTTYIITIVGTDEGYSFSDSE